MCSMWGRYKDRRVNFTNREETQFHLAVELAIKSHIQKEYKVKVLREHFLILNREDKIVSRPLEAITAAQKARRELYRCPDLCWIDEKFQLWILEVDGYVHHIKSGNTEKRNKIYEGNNCKFITVDTYEMGKTRVGNRKIENIINDVDYAILVLRT